MTRTDGEDADASETESGRRTMADVDHTHPHTNQTFAETGVYDRGEERTAEPADD